MAETLTVLLVAALLWAVYGFLDHPDPLVSGLGAKGIGEGIVEVLAREGGQVPILLAPQHGQLLHAALDAGPLRLAMAGDWAGFGGWAVGTLFIPTLALALMQAKLIADYDWILSV